MSSSKQSTKIRVALLVLTLLIMSGFWFVLPNEVPQKVDFEGNKSNAMIAKSSYYILYGIFAVAMFFLSIGLIRFSKFLQNRTNYDPYTNKQQPVTNKINDMLYIYLGPALQMMIMLAFLLKVKVMLSS